MVEYATISVQSAKGYSIKNSTSSRLSKIDIRPLALPSGSNWVSVAFYRYVKVSAAPKRCVSISLGIILPDKDKAGRSGLIYANLAVLKRRSWLSLLRKSNNIRQTIKEDIFKDFPFPDNNLDKFFEDWQSLPMSCHFSRVLLFGYITRIMMRRRVIIKGGLSTAQEWEHCTSCILQIAQIAAKYRKFVSFSTLVLNVADTSQVIAIPDSLD